MQNGLIVISSIGSIAILFVLIPLLFGSGSTMPPRLPETIPFISNTFQASVNPKAFYARALKTMQRLDTEILRFRLAGRQAFLVVGEKKTNTLFRLNSGLSVDYYYHLLVKAIIDPSERDMQRLLTDVSGRAKVPLPGTEHIAEKDRLWAAWHRIFTENLLQTIPTQDMAALFLANFAAKVTELFNVGEWSTIRVVEFLDRHQTECAARTINGSRVFEENPEYFDLLKEFELGIIPIAFGPPKWMNPKPHRARDKYLAMNKKYVTNALRDFDWNSPEASAPWEPVFGSPLIRAVIRWGLDINLDIDTISGFFGVQVINGTSNTVPASAWTVVSTLTCPDPELLTNIRREAEAAIAVDPKTGERVFDVQKLAASPWLQAVYTETLRLRSGFCIIRDAVRDTEIDGVSIAKGAIVQAPIPIAHHDAVWEAEGYAVDEFWPHRHIKVVGSTDEKGHRAEKVEFALGNRSGYYFPYGGGITMCPGRHFAKLEIMGTLALLVTQFDIEVVGWVKHDGSPSDREARNGVGMAVYHPDRDLKVRVKRRY
ncbi:cytochrome P450 [Echria macrotheca]|uniref:Cytochrome P450 n=1 Tax=Echria macrotheca TaxID=438768 RepID=A0AAJ0B1D3_9PEZI|nr:cytochrome P450 [Echria macrotheca]